MSEIYNEEGDLNYEAAALALDQIDGAPVEVITAAALLDIAVSLSVLANYAPLPVATQATAGVEHTAPARRGQAASHYEPNDWVAFAGAPDVAIRVIAIGESEGAQWVLLEGNTGRVWSDTLVPAEASAAPRRAAKAKPALVERQELADYDDDYEAGGDEDDDDALVLDAAPVKAKGKGKKKSKGVEL